MTSGVPTPKAIEAVTEGLFRARYGSSTFLEKAAIPAHYGFVSKRGTKRNGYPDFFLADSDVAIIVEAKASKHAAAETETQFYMEHNSISTDIVGMAVSGQSVARLKVTYFYRIAGSTTIESFNVRDKLLAVNEIKRLLDKHKHGELLSSEELMTVLQDINKDFHKGNKVRDTDRSLFFSGIMIALTNNNFRRTYRTIEAPSREEVSETQATVLDAHYLNNAILNAIDERLNKRVNSLSKEFSWRDKFSFIRNIDYPLSEYKALIQKIEDKIFRPYKNEEKQDILGKAYKIFLSRAGKIDNKNIILTPDHIKDLMVKLARLTVDDVVLDTCTGSGGFLMEAMEVMTRLAGDDSDKLEDIKTKQLIGFEVDAVLFALACTNMFLHGDGRSNLLYRSSLLHQGHSGKDDDILFDRIRELKPTKCIINPPYEGNAPIDFTKQALEYLEPNGRLIIIMPTPTLTKNQGSGGLTEEILQMAKLDFIISMPANLFSEQGRVARTSIFGFTKTPHKATDIVLHYNLDDDGFASIQHKGRVDTKDRWAGIERRLLDVIENGAKAPGAIRKMKIGLDGTMKATRPARAIRKSRRKRVGDLFTIEPGTLQSSKGDDTGEYDFITAADERKKHTSYKYDAEALVYAVGAGGSLGKCQYVSGKFIASNLCLVLQRKSDEPYINLTFYRHYFESMRRQIVADLAKGASKQTIAKDSFEDYIIELFDQDEQDDFVKQYVVPVERLQQKLKGASDKLQGARQRVFAT